MSPPPDNPSTPEPASPRPPSSWPPAGSYPGDRTYIMWGLLGVFWVLLGISGQPGLLVFGLSMFFWVGLLFAASGATMYIYATRLRPKVWRQVIETLGDREGVRCVDLGSRDAIATAVAVSLLPDAAATVVATSAKVEKLVNANVAALGAAGKVTVVSTSLWELPLGDGCADLVVSDSSEQLVRRRSEFPRTMAEMVRIAAPGARVAVVVGARSRGVRDALVAAGATDARISRVPMSWWSGYRLVEATMPG